MSTSPIRRLCRLFAISFRVSRFLLKADKLSEVTELAKAAIADRDFHVREKNRTPAFEDWNEYDMTCTWWAIFNKKKKRFCVNKFQNFLGGVFVIFCIFDIHDHVSYMVWHISYISIKQWWVETFVKSVFYKVGFAFRDKSLVCFLKIITAKGCWKETFIFLPFCFNLLNK